ncbi:MAG: hypothetical protein QM765_31770 [Myxococcales bacterium]
MRPLAATLALLALLTAARAQAVEGETLALCAEPGAEEQEAAVILSRWMRSVRVEVRRCVPGSTPVRRLSFVSGTDGRVLVRLETLTATREREVPWLETPGAALSRMRAKSLLARFSVLLEALVTEDRLAAPVTLVAAKPAVRKAAPATATSDAPPLPVRTTEPTATEPAAAPPPAPVPESPELALAPVPAPVSPAPEPPAPPRPERRWAFGLDGAAAYHLRSPYLSTWDFGGGLHYGPIRFAVTYQPEATWEIGDREVGTTVVGFSLGGRFALFEEGDFELGVLANLLLDHLIVRRKEEGYGFTRDSDFGVSGGLFGASRLGPAGAELRLEGMAMPTAHVIEIPGAGARRFNAFGLRVSLALFWDVWRPR